MGLLPDEKCECSSGKLKMCECLSPSRSVRSDIACSCPVADGHAKMLGSQPAALEASFIPMLQLDIVNSRGGSRSAPTGGVTLKGGL